MKASIATRGGVLWRERLFALLDAATARAVWIAGPPGAGKTTLVSSWAKARLRHCLWYRVKAADGDLASFFYELGARAGRRRPPLPHFTPEYRGGEAAFARRFFREISRGRRQPWVLVMDDLQEVASPEQLFAALREGVDELPVGARLVLVSRDEPPAIFARLMANGALSVVTGGQLRLTDAEALAIAGFHAPMRAREDLARLCARAAGWAAGVVLLANSPAGPEGAPPDPAALFQYLASEFLDRADAETRRILVDAAIAPTLPLRIVNALCGSDRAVSVLDELARRAYFVARREGDAPAFELHPLAREFLLERGRAVRSPEQLRGLVLQAASLLAGAGFAGDAADLYAAASSWADVARLALAQAPVLVGTGRVATLKAWLDALPQGVIGGQPWLSYWRGVCCLPVDPAAAREHLARAWAGFDAQADVTGLHLAFAAAIDSFICQYADLHGVHEWIDRFDEAVRRTPGVPDRAVAERSASAMLAALIFCRPHSEALPQWEAFAMRVVEDASAPASTRLTMGQYLLVKCALRGDGVRGARVVRTLAPLARAPGADVIPALGWLCAEGVHFWNTGSPGSAEAAGRLGLEIARERGVHVWDFLLWQQIVFASLAAGDPARARRHIAAMESATRLGGSLQAFSRYEMDALVARHEGDAARAVTAARAMMAIASETGIAFAMQLGGAFHLVLGLVEAGDPAARSELEALRRAKATWKGLAEMLLELAEAELDRRSGDLVAAGKHLERGFRASRENGIVPDVWFSRERLAQLCALALDMDIETAQVLGLVRRLELAAPPGCGSERWPWTVHARLLGRMEVHVRGAALRALARTRRRPLDVLAALVASDGARSAGEVAAALWPESDGDLAQHALETATWRLRRMLGQDVVHQRDGALVLDRARCWTDVAELDGHLRRAAAYLQRRDHGGALSSTERAVALYRGPFLPDREEPWVLAAREAHRVRLRRCLCDLERLGSDPEAVQLLRRRAEAADPEFASWAAGNGG